MYIQYLNLVLKYIVFGTALLSSAVLIAPGDAILVILRLAVSAIFCRSVLLFELYGLREVIEVIPLELENSSYEELLAGIAKP
jgi:hypothetical protein